MTDINRLWVNVSCISEENLFAVYPQLLAAMLAETRASSHGAPDFEVLLPSDVDWQTRIYYQLVEKQRGISHMAQCAAFLDRPRSAGPWDTTIPPPPAKKPRCTLSASLSSNLSVTSTVIVVHWNVYDIVKAASLMNEPPLEVEFKDEQEMRRVYSLIYDVFRYRVVLSQALEDVAFFYLFPELRANKYHVWLLLYDFYHRRFGDRDHSDGSSDVVEQLFPKCGLMDVETALWATRVRLAAALSRLRIANSALKLSDMLPFHLRDEKVMKMVWYAPVTCWVNRNLIKENVSPRDMVEEIKENFCLKVLSDDSSSLGLSDFRWDPLCPMFLSFHHSQRVNLAQSSYVRDNILIMQNRSFCFGPAIFCKLLYQHNLTGSVIQTHINSPRSTAYFATLLAENKQIYSLLVFGAGNRKQEYEQYFENLKIKNILVFSQRLIDFESDATILEPVVAVFATPPNSYSAVNDPIDLVCSKGGDLSMLEILTDTSNSLEARKRVASILEEQRLTLRCSMTRPQIQFVLYETHSQLNAENDDMVFQVIHEVNRAAQYKHAELLGKISHSKTESSLSLAAESTEINNNEMDLAKDSTIESAEEDSEESTDSEEEILKSIEVPPTDSFEKHSLPDLCFNSDQCLKLSEEGCYLALIQRKVVTRFDAKYMIKMAEGRGLFGGKNTPANKPKSKTNKSRKKEAPSTTKRVKRKRGSFEIDRIAAQTHASIMRSCSHPLRTENGDVAVKCCRRHIAEEPQMQISPARLWWAETTKYLSRLKKSLIRQKILSKNSNMLHAVNSDKINKDISHIDEILCCRAYRKEPNIPVFPKLRLSRSPTNKLEREPYPLFVKSIEIENQDLDSI